MSDIDIIKLAQKEQRIIITLDKDFITLIQYPKYQVSTIVIRLKILKSENIISYLDELFVVKPLRLRMKIHKNRRVFYGLNWYLHIG